MTFESNVVPEDWRSVVIISSYMVKERGLNVRIKEIFGY